MNAYILRISMLFLIPVLLFSCKKDSQEKKPAEVKTNLSYGQHASHLMDVYLPQNRNGNTPVMIIIHGGGFVAGSKEDLAQVAEKLQQKGVVVININYRLVDATGILENPPVHKASEITVHNQLDDVDAAMKFVRSKIEEWGIGSEKWFIAGHSAGATLAMLYAYGPDNSDLQIKAVANWAGAVTLAFSDESEFDLYDPRLKEIYFRIVGAEPINNNKLAYMAVSPYWIAYNTGGISTLNIEPEDNSVGDIEDTSGSFERFTELLNSKGTQSRYVVIKGADHGFSKPGNWDTVVKETMDFFNIH